MSLLKRKNAVDKYNTFIENIFHLNLEWTYIIKFGFDVIYNMQTK